MTIPILKYSDTPVYIQISYALKDEINSSLRPGDFLPSERELSKRFGVNRHTVRHAIGDLVQAGLVDRLHGRGVMVVNLPFEYNVGPHTRFTENIESAGLWSENKILRKDEILASSGVAEKLCIDQGQKVVFIETLRLINGLTAGITSHFLPLRLAELVSKYKGGSLHSFLRKRFGIRPIRKFSLITASLPQGNDAQLLKMSRTQPVLRIKSLNVDAEDGLPVEYVLTRFRADLIQLNVNFDDNKTESTLASKRIIKDIKDVEL